MKKVLVFFGLIVSCNLVVASSLDGFDGKKWGTSVNAIVKERGDPKLVFKSSDLWVWDVTEPETLGGYQIETIHYHFKNCAKVGYFVDEMWGGKYILSEPSDQLFNEISPKLVSRYGDVTQQSTSKNDKNEYVSNIFVLDDGSKVKLTYGQTIQVPREPVTVFIAYSSREREQHLNTVCPELLKIEEAKKNKRKNKDF